jgi:hypothetical protein
MKEIGAAALCGAMLMLVAPSPALAQAQDDAAPVVFGIYYRCSQGQEARTDEIFAASVAPVAQKYIDSGDITGALWLTHVQGGAWRRLWAVVGTDIPTMMDVRAAITDEIDADAAAELTSICPSHDDYIWTGVANAPIDPDRISGPATLSAYRTCNVSREARADEIFTSLLAPLYQKHTDMGHLDGWAFYAHRMGGSFRRLETMSGADHKTLLAMQEAIYTEANETDAAAMQEFNEICGSHSDYMWENSGGQ